jgi:LacI family transcriptional regulator
MATIYDVARQAGVSPKTVSRVINGDAPVNAKTRDIVQRAMGSLDYVPSSAARAMRSNKTGLVGLITGAISAAPSGNELAGLPDMLIVQGLQKSLADGGLTLLISDTGGDASRVATLMRTFSEHRVEAVIYVADYHRAVELPELSREAGLLLVNCFDTGGTPCIVPDDRRGQRELVARLIDAGHRRIGFLTLPDDLVAYRLRLAGYRDALAAAGIDFDPALVRPVGLHHQGPQETILIGDAVKEMMALGAPPTILCCGNDRMAMQLYGVLRSAGHAVPERMSVAGYDDYRMISETLYPPLTTAVLPYHDMGMRAGELLLGKLRGKADLPREPILVSGPIVWRQSVTELNGSANV